MQVSVQKTICPTKGHNYKQFLFQVQVLEFKADNVAEGVSMIFKQNFK